MEVWVNTFFFFKKKHCIFLLIFWSPCLFSICCSKRKRNVLIKLIFPNIKVFSSIFHLTNIITLLHYMIHETRHSNVNRIYFFSFKYFELNIIDKWVSLDQKIYDVPSPIIWVEETVFVTFFFFILFSI